MAGLKRNIMRECDEYFENIKPNIVKVRMYYNCIHFV